MPTLNGFVVPRCRLVNQSSSVIGISSLLHFYRLPAVEHSPWNVMLSPLLTAFTKRPKTRFFNRFFSKSSVGLLYHFRCYSRFFCTLLACHFNDDGGGGDDEMWYDSTSRTVDALVDEVAGCVSVQQEMLQKLIELQQDLVGIDCLLHPNRVRLFVSLSVCPHSWGPGFSISGDMIVIKHRVTNSCRIVVLCPAGALLYFAPIPSTKLGCVTEFCTVQLMH